MRSEGPDRDSYERHTWALTEGGEEYEGGYSEGENVRCISLERYAVLKTRGWTEPKLVGLFESIDEASDEADRINRSGDKAFIQTVYVDTDVEELGGVFRERLHYRRNTSEPGSERSDDIRRTIDLFRWKISEGIVSVDGKFKWLCSCGAEGMDLHETKDKAQDALWEHRTRNSCGHGGPPER